MPRCPRCHRRVAAGQACPRDGSVASGSALTASAVDRPVVPGYHIDTLLGVGGFASIWAARRDYDGLEVAIKVSRDILRTEREGKVLAQLGPPWVPHLHTGGPLGESSYFLAMERLRGRPLAALLEELGDLPGLGLVREIAMAVLDLLRHIHGQGLVHGDLKPENIFLVAESPVAARLIDFGLARGEILDRTGRVTRSGVILGTAEYMAPEQVRGGQVIDARTDVYAFGVLLYELLTLRPPFTGDLASVEHGHTSLRPPLLRQFAPVPQPVENVVLACLAKDPDRRPADAGAVARALDRAFTRITPHDSGARMIDSRVSLLVDKHEVVVLLLLDSDAGTFRVNEEVKQQGGFVAWQRGSRYLCVFAGLMVEDPGRAALTVGHAMVADQAARAVIHLAPVTLRRRRRGPPAIKGEAVDAPDGWLPAASWDGLVMTGKFAETRSPGSARPAPACDGFYVEVTGELDERESTRLVGRDEVMARAERSLRTSLDVATPGLFTIVAEPGLGKSRLARELARLASQIAGESGVIFVPVSRDPGQAEERVLGALATVVPTTEGARRRSPAPPMVVIIDDAHLATSELLQGCEYATLDHDRVPLWLVVLADPRLETVRTRWGDRAHRHERVTLDPLDDGAARALAAELLLPAEYPPATFLDRMVAWTAGNPQLLSALAADLHRQGIVRRRGHGHGWHVATAEVAEFPAAAAPRQWLAARELGAMPPELGACVRLCAVLGPAFVRDELAWVQNALEEHGGAGTPIDTDVGLRQLVALGTLEHAGSERLRFVSPAFRDAVYQLLSEPDRELIHRHAAAYWQLRLAAASEDIDALAHFARHAGAGGRRAEAAERHLELGDHALARHDDVAAEQAYSAALRLADESLAALRIRALAGRGKAHHRLHRTKEAYEDLRAARAAAEARGDILTVIDLLLEEANAADAAMEYSLSEQCVVEARQHLAEKDEPARATRVLMGLGRAAWRQSDARLAAERLRRAYEQALAGGDEETAVVSLLLLAPALVYLGELDEAERIFAETIERCEQRGNELHRCRAYGNRMFLWAARRMPARAMEDLRQAIQLARQIGNPDPEHIATHNLAELLYWSGELDEALTLARRAYDLQQRFHQGLPYDVLLLVRIYAARGERDQATGLFRELERDCEPAEFEPMIRLLYRTMRLVLALPDETPASRDHWDELVAEARKVLPGEELLEVLFWRAETAFAHGQRDEATQAVADMQARLDETPIWKHRITQFLDRTSPR